MPSTMAPLDDEWVSLHVSPEERLRIGPEMVVGKYARKDEATGEYVDD